MARIHMDATRPAAQTASGAQTGGAPAAPAKADRDAAKIKDAARDFEAIFIQRLLQMARKATAPGQSRSGQNLYQDMMDDHLARAMSKAGGFGLADALTKDLTRQLGISKKSSSPTAPGPIQAGEGTGTVKGAQP